MTCSGEWHYPFTDTDVFPHCRNNSPAQSGHPSQQVSLF